jgi:diguanylate cyclase (GGDEF)-like protein
MFEQSADGMLVCDAAGSVLACNAVGAGLLGRPRARVVGHHVIELLQQDGVADGPAPAHPAPESGIGLVAGPARPREQAATPGPAAASEVARRPLDLRISPVSAVDGRYWLLHLRDIGERVRAEAELTHMANHDSLTGLPNRLLFQDRLRQAMIRSQRMGKPMALMFLDLDRFKLVNDSLGHEVGDRLLQHVARTLTHCMRQVDSVVRTGDRQGFTVSRLGGDEFTLIAEGIDSAEDAGVIARRLLEALSPPFTVGDEVIVVSASIGIAMYPTDDVDLDGLVRHADMAMYRSKSLGRGTYSFFSDDLNAAAAARLSLESALRRAIERQEFQLHFQPQVAVQTGEVTGVEALLRWHCPGQGMVPPDRFIAVLEETGLILPVGAWVIRAACQQLAEWDRMGLPPLRMGVNLSARQFRHLHLASMVADTLLANYIDPRRLEIELTESLLMEDNETNHGMLTNLAGLGVRLAIDDFGTGHSSLTYIKRFNIDTLKIDRSFVQSLPDSHEDVAIATAVIALGRSMRMNVVAEGVETWGQVEALRQLGCDEVQGYLLGRPMPAADLAAWLQERLQAAWHRRRNFIGPPPSIPRVDLDDIETMR